jgi:CRP/FNR family transcriptional regulator, cyclic AMP receptor protein
VATAGMFTFIAGISRLGPSRASIVSAVQPALTPLVGFAAFADRLGPEQMLGGALVVAAVVVLEAGGAALSQPAWLPWRERRTLARVAGAVEVPAGRRMLLQGAPADEFFVIEQGQATVRRDERHIADLGAGDFFGEAALREGATRTASVVAATDMRVRVMPRPAFTDAMSKLPTLACSVRAAVAERLVPAPAPVVQAR